MDTLDELVLEALQTKQGHMTSQQWDVFRSLIIVATTVRDCTQPKKAGTDD